jgi:TolB-like protein/Tfp pilus assembly protein PilF
MGDGMLISFNLASSAVNCAQDLQIEARKAEIPLKIGIHEGEMVVEEADIMGDSVNIASRLQEISVSGGIVISGEVYRDVKNKPDIKIRFRGEEKLKNVSEPLRIYEVFTGEQEGKGRIKVFKRNNKLYYLIFGGILVIALAIIMYMSFPDLERTSNIVNNGPEKLEKSIAVLPFINLSDDPLQEYFADGIMEEILTQICKIGDLKVISRTSSMKYKESDKLISEIAEELGVSYILEGSVRKSSKRVRITAQLIDTENDLHVWAENYDRNLDDIIQIQSEVAQQVAYALHANITTEVKENMESLPTRNYKAYDLYLQGNKYLREYKPRENEIAISLYKKAISMDSTFALAYASLAGAYATKVLRFGYGKMMLDSAEYYAKLSLLHDESLAEAYKTLGLIERTKNHMDLAISYTQKAIEINPNYTVAITNLGFFLVSKGNFKEGFYHLKNAIELNPRDPEPLNYMAVLYYFIGDNDMARSYYSRSLELEPDNRFALYTYLMTLEADNDWDEYKNFSNIVLNYTHDTINWYWNQGILKYNKKQYKEALMDFTKSNNPLQVADCYLNLSDTARAFAIIQEHLSNKEKSWNSRPGSWADFRISYDLALANLLLGNSDDACKWVKISLRDGRDFFYQIITNEVILDNRSLPVCINEILEVHRKDIESRASGYKYW